MTSSITLERQKPLGFRNDVFNLRQNLILKLRMVPNPGIKRGNTSHRSIQRSKQFVRNTCRDFRAVAELQQVFVNEHHAIGLLNRTAYRLPIVRRERPKIDDLHRRPGRVCSTCTAACNDFCTSAP